MPVLQDRYHDILDAESSYDLDKGIVHGDLHDEQMLFDLQTKVLVAFTDWEELHLRPRAFDIGYTVERLTTDIPKIHDLTVPLDSLTHDPKMVQTFLSTYSSKRNLSSQETGAIVDQLLAECVRKDASFLADIYSGFKTNWENVNLDKLLLYMRVMSIERMEAFGSYL
ncbi:MAG: phosphotransferase [Nanoarchaeota archaeon]